MSKVWLYDTTLRDGTQAEDVSFLVADKIRIAQKLDELGIDYIIRKSQPSALRGVPKQPLKRTITSRP
jgi:isopropylmalate/homocitrate/citramalate synthase